MVVSIGISVANLKSLIVKVESTADKRKDDKIWRRDFQTQIMLNYCLLFTHKVTMQTKSTQLYV